MVPADASADRIRTGPRLLVPAEHGAWGQLALPLLTALGAGSPGLLAALAMATVVFAFLATEGARVLRGERGPRARRERRTAALRSLMIFGAAAAVSFLAFVSVGGARAGLSFLVPGSMAMAVGAAMQAGRLKSTSGETLVAAALAAGAMPVAWASGLDVATAAWLWLVWTTAFCGATLGVRGLIAAQSGRGGAAERRTALTMIWAAAGALIVLAGAGQGSLLVALGFLPTTALVSAAALRRVDVRRLRTLGWSLVAASGILAAAMIVAVRSAG